MGRRVTNPRMRYPGWKVPAWLWLLYGRRTLQTLPAKPHDGRDLFNAVKEVWDALPKDILDRLVSSFHCRCEHVPDVKGASITPYLSGHRSSPTREVDPVLLWTPEDDDALERPYRTLGPKRTQIGRLLDKQPNAVKNRWIRPQQIRVDQLLRDEQPDPLPPTGRKSVTFSKLNF